MACKKFVVHCEFGGDGFKMTGQIDEEPEVLICQFDNHTSVNRIWPQAADMCSEYFDTKLRCMGDSMWPKRSGSDWFKNREGRHGS